MPPPSRVAQHIGQDDRQHDHQNHAIGEYSAINFKLIAHELENRRAFGNIGAADRFIGGINKIRRQKNLPCAQGHNKGWKAHDRHQYTINRPHQRARCQATN